MTEQEERFISCTWELHRAARTAAEARKTLIEGYIALHYPGVPYTLTIMEENILAVDVVFPGLDPLLGEQIVNEISEYLQSLLFVHKQQ